MTEILGRSHQIIKNTNSNQQADQNPQVSQFAQGTQQKFYAANGQYSYSEQSSSVKFGVNNSKNMQRIFAAYNSSNNNNSQSINDQTTSSTALHLKNVRKGKSLNKFAAKGQSSTVTTGGDHLTTIQDNLTRQSQQFTKKNQQQSETDLGQEVIIKSSSMQPLIGATMNSLHQSTDATSQQLQPPSENYKQNDVQQQFRIQQNSKQANLQQNNAYQQHTPGMIVMNRRPKMNDHNIKLIEKVIKRQNLTAQQESRPNHHMQSFLQHANSQDSVSYQMNENNRRGISTNDNQSNEQQTVFQSAQKSLSKSPNSVMNGKTSMFNDEDSVSSMIKGPPDYISERIEKTIQKYTKKDVKGSNGVLGNQQFGANPLQSTNTKFINTRNGGLQAPVQSGSVNSINYVHKIYNSTIKNGVGAQNKSVINGQSLQSPYLNGNVNNGTLYNLKNGGTKFSGKLLQNQAHVPSHQMNMSQLNLEQLDQFRQVNSYSVDRINSNGFVSSVNHSAIKNQLSINQNGSAEKSESRGINDLSFESMNINNNSYTMGYLNNKNQSSTQELDDLTPQSHLSEDIVTQKQQMQSTSSVQKKLRNFPQEGFAKSGINTIPSSSFTHSNQKGGQGFDETPTQMKQSQNLQQSPILQPMLKSTNGANSASGGLRKALYGHQINQPPISFAGSLQGFQDLFYDESSHQLDANSQSQQQIWSQQMVQKNYNQQKHIQIKQILQQKDLANNIDSSPGVVYTITSQSKLQMSPMQFQPQMQYSKSRDGGYRNIPTRDLSSISDQSPQSVFLKKAAGYENQHPNTGNIVGNHVEDHPFKRPKLHLFKKDASRRIKTSSATRNLQPIYPLEGLGGAYSGNKIFSNNFNSIHVGGGAGTTTSSNPPSFIKNTDGNNDSQPYYNNSTYISKKFALNSQPQSQQQYAPIANGSQQDAQSNLGSQNSNIIISLPLTNPQSQLQLRKPAQNNPFSNIQASSHSGHTTIDVSQNAGESDLLMPRLSALSSIPDPEQLAQRISQISNIESRPFTSININSEEKEVDDQSPQDEQKFSQQQLSQQRESKKNLQQEINGFKHSFYVDKEASQKLRINGIGINIASGQSSNANNTMYNQGQDLAKQPGNNLLGPNKMLHEKYTSTQIVDKEGGVKQIFVLNVNATGNNHSIQESKAMTPCFLHTPNMTNKWNDFKPPPSGDSIKQSLQQSNSRLIHHQANPSQQSDVNPIMSQQSEDEKADQKKEMLFTKTKTFQYSQNGPEIQVTGNIKELQNQTKKPMTSHQSSKNDKKNIQILQKGADCSIKLCPQDIYLQTSTTTGTAKGTSLPNKPSTSGSSFRRPLSRNHPMLNLVQKATLSQEPNTQPINVLSQQRGSLTTGASNALIKFNNRMQAKTMNHKNQNQLQPAFGSDDQPSV